MRILSIQSSVAYGHVGNSAATFPLQRLGHDVWPVLTVHFSNHTGYGSWRGQVLDSAVVSDVIKGIDDLGLLGTVDAVLTGYQGSPGVAEVVLDTVARIRRLNRDVVYCCDPVMGDVDRGMFVLPGVPELIRDRVVPVADVVTPNVFELAYLAGVTLDEIADLPGLLAAVQRVRAMGPSTVLVTSVNGAVGGPGPDTAAGPDTPAGPDTAAGLGEIAMLAVDPTGAFLVRTPRLPISVNGAGDVTAALFLAHLRSGIQTALARVASSVYAILRRTAEVGAREIQLIQAQDEIAHPACEFPVFRLD
ncbi:pyridoxal kinase [Nakamurella sp. PAMC28650]|uniref:pyridoxal kinase n=1 Tax=Nakamurella sp. PAMC28650 TaxID=2762325 RepID=UPI00164DAF98|nr:pyridoxal kinase [Nakamurella sp. PAMC28650]QNK82280.1 pyridoxal kinase [Nakamurella sp. PAMC28650]